MELSHDYCYEASLNWTAAEAIGTIASAVVTTGLAVATVWMAYISKQGLDAEESREKSRRTPFLLFDFADVPEHENQGPIGFRHIQNKQELLVSGTMKNVGNALALDVKLDIFSFWIDGSTSTNALVGISVADAVPPGGGAQWVKSIGMSEFSRQNDFLQQGVAGLFASATDKFFPFHVVFYCKNIENEIFSSIYCVEYASKDGSIPGTRMVFKRAIGKYEPNYEFPREWQAEFQKKKARQGFFPDKTK